MDVYELCSDELKKSLDLGREFERKQREEEDNRILQGKEKEDVVMKADDEEEEKVQKPVDKAALKEKEIKVSDEILYRQHGLGLDTGNY